MSSNIRPYQTNDALEALKLISCAGYEFHPDDYEQLLEWAELANFSIDKVIKLFEENESIYEGFFRFSIIGGRIVSLVWDESLPIKEIVFKKSLRLTKFECRKCNVEVLDISKLPKLGEINCNENMLTELDVSKLVNLTILNCTHNQIAELNVANLVNLKELWCCVNDISELNVANLELLTHLNCSFNQLTELDVAHLELLTHLDCSFNQLTELDVAQLVNLKVLDCSDNKLTDLDVVQLANLQSLRCSENQLTQLNLEGCVNLKELICTNNKITKLDVASLVNLEKLECDEFVEVIGRPRNSSISESLPQKPLRSEKPKQILDAEKELESWAEKLWEWEKLNNFYDQAEEFALFYTCYPREISEIISLESYTIAMDLDPEFFPITMNYEIPVEIKNLSSLKSLYFSISNCTVFPKQLCDFKKLELLYINSSDNLIALPKDIERLLNLKSLKIYNCKSLQSIPDEISNLKNLEYLEITECGSLESIPESITRLENLISLELDVIHKNEKWVKDLAIDVKVKWIE